MNTQKLKAGRKGVGGGDKIDVWWPRIVYAPNMETVCENIERLNGKYTKDMSVRNYLNEGKVSQRMGRGALQMMWYSGRCQAEHAGRRANRTYSLRKRCVSSLLENPRRFEQRIHLEHWNSKQTELSILWKKNKYILFSQYFVSSWETERATAAILFFTVTKFPQLHGKLNGVNFTPATHL